MYHVVNLIDNCEYEINLRLIEYIKYQDRHLETAKTIVVMKSGLILEVSDNDGEYIAYEAKKKS